MTAFLDFLFTNPIINPTGCPVTDFMIGLTIAMAIGCWLVSPPRPIRVKRPY